MKGHGGPTVPSSWAWEQTQGTGSGSAGLPLPRHPHATPQPIPRRLLSNLSGSTFQALDMSDDEVGSLLQKAVPS